MTSPKGAGLPVALLVSVLLMLGIAIVGVAAGPDVVSLDLDSRSAPVEVTTPEEEPAEGAETANETYLREVLGDDFEIEGEELTANNLDGLPAELVAHASITLTAPPDGAFTCENIVESTESACEERHVSGDTFLVETTQARHSAAGSNFGELTIRYLRDDGDLAIVQLFVLGKPAEGSTAELQQDVTDYLASQEDALIAAALDERMRAS